jgi:streptogramin lyase
MEHFQRWRGWAAPGTSRRGPGKKKERRRQPRLEGLESRQLLSTTVNDGLALSADAAPEGITNGPNGTVWFADTGDNSPGQTNYIQSITTNGNGGGTLNSPIAVGVETDPTGITYVPGGNIWFTEAGSSAIGEIDPATGTFLKDFATTTTGSTPQGITYDPANGLVYFTEILSGQIGYFNPATITSPADITEIKLPTNIFGASSQSLPNGITYDPADGDLWFVAQGSNQIGMFDPATNAFNTTGYNLPNASANPRPTSIAVGSDGNLWFNDYTTGQVDMFDPATKAFAANGPWSLPTAAVNANPGAPIAGVAAGPDGDIYVTVGGNGQIGWFNPTALAATKNPNSVIGFVSTPNTQSGPTGIAAASDGNVWFTELDGATGDGAIGVADLGTQISVTTAPPSSVTAGGTFGLTIAVDYANGGAVDTGFSGPVTAALEGGPAGSSLGGNTTVSAVGGVATFTNLTISDAGSGYSLRLSGNAATATATTPGTITVTPSPTSPTPTTPTITWPSPAGIVYGTALTTAQLDATASVPGTFTYSPPLGTVLGAGTDTLSVTFTPKDSTDYRIATKVTTIAVAPTSPTTTPTPTPAPTIIAEQISSVYLKHNKRGKGIGKPVEEFVLTFSTAMDAGTIGNAANYQVAWASTRKVKRKLQTTLHPVSVLSATPNSADTAVTLLTSAVKTKFAKGGQVTVVSPGSVQSAAGVSLAAPTVFIVTPRAGGIAPQG